MMMIAFVTINSGLVPLIRRVYALKSYILGLRSSVVCVHIFAFLFWNKKYLKEKNS